MDYNTAWFAKARDGPRLAVNKVMKISFLWGLVIVMKFHYRSPYGADDTEL